MLHTGKENSSDISIKHRLTQVLLLVFVCLIFGLIDSFRSYAETYHGGKFQGAFYYILRWDLTGWVAWAFFIPIVFWLCNRYPLNRKTWKKVLPMFIVVGLLFSLVRTLFPILVHVTIFEGVADLQSWLPNKFFILVTDYIVALGFYALILTFGQAKHYYARYHDEEIRTSRLEAQLSKAELQALKMQLHPHFLFNVLNSIAALQLEDPSTAQEMTVRLGDFLRMTLDNVGAQEVTLEKEIAMIECYLEIEKIRFGSRLTTSIDISGDTLDLKVPNLILQPIVENSIRHGIAPQNMAGHISISATNENQRLSLKITDTGQGVENTDEIFSKGVGLSNTRARLKQLYGNDYDLNFDNANGLVVTISFPIESYANLKKSKEKGIV